eukprot:COSAG01_NODE_2501_length_7558_cov_27.574206_3_plen_70_part_00
MVIAQPIAKGGNSEISDGNHSTDHPLGSPFETTFSNRYVSPFEHQSFANRTLHLISILALLFESIAWSN